jgi:hypothetical protein
MQSVDEDMRTSKQQMLNIVTDAEHSHIKLVANRTLLCLSLVQILIEKLGEKIIEFRKNR